MYKIHPERNPKMLASTAKHIADKVNASTEIMANTMTLIKAECERGKYSCYSNEDLTEQNVSYLTDVLGFVVRWNRATLLWEISWG